MSARYHQQLDDLDDEWVKDLPDLSQADVDEDHEDVPMDNTLMNPDIPGERRYVNNGAWKFRHHFFGNTPSIFAQLNFFSYELHCV